MNSLMTSLRRGRFPSLAVKLPEYQMCAQCIMDTTDPEILFDSAGVCNHCHRYHAVVATDTMRGAEGRAALESTASRIRADGKGKRYDCIIGLSGGVDSSYVAYLTRELGLRPGALAHSALQDRHAIGRRILARQQSPLVLRHGHLWPWFDLARPGFAAHLPN
jgi:hypothetical protein